MVVVTVFTYFFHFTSTPAVVVVVIPAFTYFLRNFTGRRLGPKYGGQRKFLPNSEYLVNKMIVQNIILIFYIPLNRSFEYFYDLIVSLFLLTGWGGGGVRGGDKIPCLGSLPPGVKIPWSAPPARPHTLTHLETYKLRSEKQFYHFQLKILEWVVVPAFTYFFTWDQNTVAQAVRSL